MTLLKEKLIVGTLGSELKSWLQEPYLYANDKQAYREQREISIFTKLPTSLEKNLNLQ